MQLKNFEKFENKIKSSYEHFSSAINFNEYLDRYFLKLRGLLATKLNPMHLEPTETTFQCGYWFWSFTANLKLDETKLYRLHEVQRSGLPNVKYKDRNLFLSSQMTFPELELTSHYLLTVFNRVNDGNIKVRVKNLMADVKFRWDIEQLKTKLEKLKLKTDKSIDVQLGGDSGNILGSAFLKAVANLFKSQLLSSVEDALRESIEEALEKVPIMD